MEISQRYRIVRFVARGGMGEVYEARDEALGERIALKTVSAHDAGDTEALRALKMEVQLARRISHKNVCRIYDLGKHVLPNGSGVGFLTMEFIDGASLAERIAASVKLEVDTARAIAIGILEGLRAAHQAGVIHRDLKSDNVMLRTDREGVLEPVLMDFGLASALNPNESRVSGDQALVGSLAYMAPEQVRGEPLRVATDLYAFGVILFEMLTGRLPFEGPTPAIAAIRRLQEPAPSLRSIDPHLPVELERVIARCLERDPKRRYSSAKAILEALGAPLATFASGRAAGASEAGNASSATGDGSGLSSEEDSGRARTGLAISAPMPAPRIERRRVAALSLVGLLAALVLTVWWVSNSARRAAPNEEPRVAGDGAKVLPSRSAQETPRAAPSSAAPHLPSQGTAVPAASGVGHRPSAAAPASSSPARRASGVSSAAPSSSSIASLSVHPTPSSSASAGLGAAPGRPCPVGLLCPKSLAEPQSSSQSSSP
jgi:serine/threonine protein kinase